MKPNRFEKIPKIPRYISLNFLHYISEPQSALKALLFLGEFGKPWKI
jgi:hypothetical protein